MPGRSRRRKLSLISCPAEEGAHFSFCEKRTWRRKEGGREGGGREGKMGVSYRQKIVSKM
jgi:hypothetical protein